MARLRSSRCFSSRNEDDIKPTHPQHSTNNHAPVTCAQRLASRVIATPPPRATTRAATVNAKENASIQPLIVFQRVSAMCCRDTPHAIHSWRSVAQTSTFYRRPDRESGLFLFLLSLA